MYESCISIEQIEKKIISEKNKNPQIIPISWQEIPFIKIGIPPTIPNIRNINEEFRFPLLNLKQ